jgi:hypothetical protein
VEFWWVNEVKEKMEQWNCQNLAVRLSKIVSPQRQGDGAARLLRQPTPNHQDQVAASNER